MTICSFEGRVPRIAATAYVAPSALVIGDVEERHAMMSRRAKDIYVDLAARYLAGGMVEVDQVRESRESD
jgi:hypothetical protein